MDKEKLIQALKDSITYSSNNRLTQGQLEMNEKLNFAIKFIEEFIKNNPN